jgi:hypothetical protein
MSGFHSMDYGSLAVHDPPLVSRFHFLDWFLGVHDPSLMNHRSVLHSPDRRMGHSVSSIVDRSKVGVGGVGSVGCVGESLIADHAAIKRKTTLETRPSELISSVDAGVVAHIDATVGVIALVSVEALELAEVP